MNQTANAPTETSWTRVSGPTEDDNKVWRRGDGLEGAAADCADKYYAALAEYRDILEFCHVLSSINRELQEGYLATLNAKERLKYAADLANDDFVQMLNVPSDSILHRIFQLQISHIKEMSKAT